MPRNPIDALLYRLRRRIHLQSAGMFGTFKKGEGFDFAEIAPYAEGTDAKRIFWKSFAKGTREPQVKSYYEELRINIVVAVLLGGSLRFGKPVQKREKLIEILAILGLATHHSGNLFQGYCYSDEGSFGIPSQKREVGIEHFIRRVADIDPLYHRASIQKGCEELFVKIRKKSLLFLLGDFLEMVDLKKLSARHEVVVLIVRDRFEADPAALGDVVLADPESGEEAELFFDDETARAYAKRYREHDAALLRHLRKLGIRYRYLYTDEDPFWKLLRL